MDSTSRRQIFSTLSAGGALAALGVAASSTASAAPSITQSLTTAVNGVLSGLTNPALSTVTGFAGTFTLTKTQVVNGVLSAVGTITGNLLDSTGNVVQSVTQTITIPLQAAGSCQILTLTLGPLYLDVLGLVITLNQVTLNITAVPGAGNLLGNLLCDIANLLNGGGALGTLLSGLLNQLIGALGGL